MSYEQAARSPTGAGHGAAALGRGVAAALVAGWPEPGTLSTQDLQRAAALYKRIRAEDARLQQVWSVAAARVQTWTGCTPRDIGSFALRTNLPGSDLDVGIGIPPGNHDSLIDALEGGRAVFLGAQPTRFGPSRLAFALSIDEVAIDITALHEADFAAACAMTTLIATAMSEAERTAYTWVKYELTQAGERDAVESWKMAPYRRYLPDAARRPG